MISWHQQQSDGLRTGDGVGRMVGRVTCVELSCLRFEIPHRSLGGGRIFIIQAFWVECPGCTSHGALSGQSVQSSLCLPGMHEWPLTFFQYTYMSYVYTRLLQAIQRSLCLSSSLLEVVKPLDLHSGKWQEKLRHAVVCVVRIGANYQCFDVFCN